MQADPLNGRPRLAQILIADDDPIFLASIATALSGAGYGTVVASSGEHAVKAIKRNTLNLVILDCGLADPSELAIMDALQRLPVPIPVMVLSARRGDWHERVMRTYGARRILAKPISGEMLVDEVRKVLAGAGPDNG